MIVDLKEKVAIVTGAASGIGLATVQEFVASDVRGLIAVDLSPTVPDSLKSLVKDHPDRVVYVGGDVGVESTAEQFARAAVEKFGRIDIMLNNAGINVVKPIHEHNEADYDRVMNTNVKALFWSARHVIPVMIKQNSGVILNTGSISGFVGILGQGVYGPSKGAVHQMTRQMAIEYAKYGIRVNAVAFGTVRTQLLDLSASQTDNPEAFFTSLKVAHPIGRIAAPEEAAKFFTYLASDHASFFTGAILSMDGGFIAI